MRGSATAPAAETAWAVDGVAGQLQDDSMLVGLVNRGGNKLDQYTTMAVHLQVSGAGHEDVTLTVDIHNATPPGQVQQIAQMGQQGQGAAAPAAEAAHSEADAAETVGLEEEADGAGAGTEGAERAPIEVGAQQTPEQRTL